MPGSIGTEALAGIMTTPFYRELGFTREDVATLATLFGMVAALAGALAGSALIARIGIGRALVLTGLGGHGVAAIYDSGKAGPTVLFRSRIHI